MLYIEILYPYYLIISIIYQKNLNGNNSGHILNDKQLQRFNRGRTFVAEQFGSFLLEYINTVFKIFTAFGILMA